GFSEQNVFYTMQPLVLLTLVASAAALHPPCGVGVIKPDLTYGMAYERSHPKGVVPGEAITNCIKSVEHAWPWTAGVCQNDWFGTCNFKCVATIIGERWALTTASCISGDLKDWHVRGGMYHENKKESGEQRLAVKAVYQHPSYAPSTKLDNILLIETKDEFKFDDYVQPICLPEEDDDVFSSNLFGWVTGWGNQKDGGSINKSMEQALIDMDDDEVCERTWARKIYDSEKCAGEGDKTLCQYDEGVPLMVQSPNGTWFQHGSAAMIDGACRLPAIFSKISYFCNWIFTTTNEDVHCIKRM
ncbi:hypothetical protein PMAYCL1PPCAC_22848, partial [Pristionchus mayeri]